MMLQAGEVIAGYMIGTQAWRWLDHGHCLEVTITLGPPAGPKDFVPSRAFRGLLRGMWLMCAIGAGSLIGDALRAQVEDAAYAGGPWL